MLSAMLLTIVILVQSVVREMNTVEAKETYDKQK